MDVYAHWYSEYKKESYDKVFHVKKGYPTKKFWDDWKVDKDKLKELGYRVKKDIKTGKYHLSHWKLLNDQELKDYLEGKKTRKVKSDEEYKYRREVVLSNNNNKVPERKVIVNKSDSNFVL
jgi:hypothetical protein